MGCLNGRFRFLIVLVAFCCLTIINSNYININFTFICMKDDLSDGMLDENGNLTSRYAYSPQEKKYIIWSVAAGTIIGTFPINIAYIKFGARIPFLIAGILSTVATALLPIVASASFPLLLVIRFVQGLAYSADFAAIGIICVRWAPLSETGTFISMLTSFTPVSTMITNPVAGFFCSSQLGWKASFYAHSIASFIYFLIWLFTYRDDPQCHPNLSEKELKHINKGKSAAHIAGDKYIPYWDIVTNKTILIVWFNAFTEMTTGFLIISYSPTYFNMALGFDISTTAQLTAATFLPVVPLRLIAGVISDRFNGITERKKMMAFNSVAVGAAGVFLAMIGLVGTAKGGWLSVIFFCSVNMAICINSGAFYKCGTLVSRQYAHFVLATIQFMKCVALVSAPAIVTFFVRDEHNASEWAPVFYLSGGLMIFANFLFFIVCTDQPASFTLKTGASEADVKKTHELQNDPENKSNSKS